MSTRANIIITDGQTTLYFYRHSDGYPKETGADLVEFCKGYSKHLRDNPNQSGGWLIIHGHNSMEKYAGYEWKVGNYEPTDKLHGDVEYIYVINLETRKIECYQPTRKFWDDSSLDNCKLSKEFAHAFPWGET